MIKTIVEQGNFIAGVWQKVGSGKFLDVYHKYHHDLIARLPMASGKQVEDAIQASVGGYRELRSWSAGKRSDYLERLMAKIALHKESLTQIIIDEAGKPRGYAATEIDRVLITLRTAVHESLRFGGDQVAIDFANGEGKTAVTRRIPVGPVLCICPFNFPLNLIMHKVAPALAAGCSVIIKPSPQAPLAGLALAHLLDEVGYPKGVVSVLCCDIPEAEAMVKDERLAMVSFTGSDRVGWHLKNICGRKKVALELGGNGAVVIDSGVDLAQAAKAIATGAYLYAGQICISTQRIFVQENDFDPFVAFLEAETKKLKVGDPNDPGVTVGPMIDKGNLERVKFWVDEAVGMGAKVLFGGKIQNEKHHLYEPTLLTNTNPKMKIVSEEVFGPVAFVEKTKSFRDALDRVNDSRFGLQAGVFTNDITHMKEAFEVLEVGGVIINNTPGFRIDNMPYGGVKQSGFGREGVRYAMEEMTEIRLLVY